LLAALKKLRMRNSLLLFGNVLFALFSFYSFKSASPGNSEILSPVVSRPLQDTAIIAPGATLQLVSKQFSFTEGPATNKKGVVFFTDQPNDKIWKWDNGTLSVFLDKSRRANGMYFDKKGNLIACAEEKNEIICISPKGKVTVLLSEFEGKKLNGPNDLWIDNKGGIYFTDPYFQRSFWERKAPDIKEQRLYYLPKGKKQAVIADSNYQVPNGIMGTRDGKTLYVADMRGRKTYRYNIMLDGSLSNKQVFVEQGSDGMAIDERGNIYLTGNGVSVYDSQGKKIQQIAVQGTTNVCFGGKNKDILFITARDAVYTLQMKVRGAE
jgi:gluconolactonase